MLTHMDPEPLVSMNDPVGVAIAAFLFFFATAGWIAAGDFVYSCWDKYQQSESAKKKLKTGMARRGTLR